MIYASIIIPTLNRSALLRKTLASIAHQTYPQNNLEVIIVDNGSTDNTRDVVAEFTGQLKNLQYHHMTKPGLHEGRHAGMRASSGEVLIFGDDDIEALPTWVEGVAESFEDSRVALTGGKNIGNYESPPPPWIDTLWETAEGGRYLTYFSILDLGEKPKHVHPHFIFGCNFSIRKKVLMTIGGFHPDGMPERLLKYRGDGETFVANEVQNLGYQTLYNPKASVKHWVPASRMNLEYLKKRAYAEGITQSYMDTRYKRKTSSGFLSALRKFVRQKINLANPIEHALQQAFQNGYNFHQQELKNDKALAAWVTKESYL